MRKTVRAKVYKETPDGTYFIVLVPSESLSEEIKRYTSDGILKGELRIDDNRLITAVQRKKAYATIDDIADWVGDRRTAAKEDMKREFMIATGESYFSLSGCTMNIARLFISFLLDFAMKNGIPLMDTAVNRTDDIDAALYSSLKHKRCIACGRDGEIHHWDSIGMGRDRLDFDDGKLRKICLCRNHRNEAHNIGRDTFGQRYHVYGIIYNE